MTPDLERACAEAMHVVCHDGRMLRAGRAALYVFAGLGWRHTAAFLSLPPMVWIVELAYRLVASNRALFNRLLFPR